MRRRRASGAPSKRRWLRYGIIVGILLLFVIVYETGQQLRRGSTGTERQATAPDAGEAVEPADTARRLKRYYPDFRNSARHSANLTVFRP